MDMIRYWWGQFRWVERLLEFELQLSLEVHLKAMALGYLKAVAPANDDVKCHPKSSIYEVGNGSFR